MKTQNYQMHRRCHRETRRQEHISFLRWFEKLPSGRINFSSGFLDFRWQRWNKRLSENCLTCIYNCPFKIDIQDNWICTTGKQNGRVLTSAHTLLLVFRWKNMWRINVPTVFMLLMVGIQLHKLRWKNVKPAIHIPVNTRIILPLQDNPYSLAIHKWIIYVHGRNYPLVGKSHLSVMIQYVCGIINCRSFACWTGGKSFPDCCLCLIFRFKVSSFGARR